MFYDLKIMSYEYLVTHHQSGDTMSTTKAESGTNLPHTNLFGHLVYIHCIKAIALILFASIIFAMSTTSTSIELQTISISS